MEAIKRCTNCGRFWGEASGFNWLNKSKGYRQSVCKKCKTSLTKIDRYLNPDKHRAWYRSGQRERNRRWYKKNPGYALANCRKYQARKKAAVAPDANFEKINKVYKKCAERNKNAGFIKYHVDHIQPLSKGGLHHEDNLQILLAVDNLQKGAKENWQKPTNQ